MSDQDILTFEIYILLFLLREMNSINFDVIRIIPESDSRQAANQEPLSQHIINVKTVTAKAIQGARTSSSWYFSGGTYLSLTNNEHVMFSFFW